MGLPAGERDVTGRFPAASVFGRVERRIIEIAERLRQAEAHGFAEEGGMDEGGGELPENGDFRMLKAPAAPAPAARPLPRPTTGPAYPRSRG